MVTGGSAGTHHSSPASWNGSASPGPAADAPRTRPARVNADRAYSSRAIRACLRRRQIPHTFPEKRDQVGHRLRRGSAGGRPPGFDREAYKRRH